ncbi:Disease resistance protein (CC-NBS-LRR class) family [Rhynchospora pubera]|uniref:Disease resistance protein (CC-NBS-LRR class) family n=1 Tax=Rhynchospora pubera TaxID=906938 RepID=A0AAV8DTG4_9POAL|nr:Disease resistance protein (CC-NBS-LRR class) family [Rhynchospora pubera]
MWIGGVISNIHSLGTKLLHAVNQFSSQPSSSSSPQSESHQIETELKNLTELLQHIKATLSDAEEREIRDLQVKHWLKEIRRVAYHAEDVLDEYHYEVLGAQVEARNASPPNSLKRKLIQVPDGMLDQIQQIRSKFAEIAQHRIALQLSEEEAPRLHSDSQIVLTSHMVVESNIIGLQREKEELINLLYSENHDGKIISVVTIVGTGGIGKTTLAQLVYGCVWIGVGRREEGKKWEEVLGSV